MIGAGYRLFLDTAEIAAWRPWAPLAPFSGVTTNPTRPARAGQAVAAELLEDEASMRAAAVFEADAHRSG